MWTYGTFTMGSNMINYLAQVSNEPTDEGLNHGRICKLTIEINGRESYQFDQGWKKYIEDKDAQLIIDQTIEKVFEKLGNLKEVIL